MPNADVAQKLKIWGEKGWTAKKTAGGHWKLSHPEAERDVFAPATPSDWRSMKNVEAQIKRLTNDPTEKVQGAREKKVHRKSGDSPAPYFDMYASRNVRPRDVVVENETYQIKYTPDDIKAWKYCYSRMRAEGKELSLIHVIKKRYRHDPVFAQMVLDGYYASLNPKAQRLPPIKAVQPVEEPFVPTPLEVKLTHDEQMGLLQKKLVEITHALRSEQDSKSQLEQSLLALKSTTDRDLLEMRTRKNHAEATRDVAQQALAEEKERQRALKKSGDPIAFNQQLADLSQQLAGIITRITALEARGTQTTHPVKPPAPTPKPPAIVAKPSKKPAPPAPPETVGDRLRNARKALGMTQQECGEMIGVTGSLVSSWEAGRYPVPEHRMKAVSSAVRMKLARLRG